jgi:hypothetical protein
VDPERARLLAVHARHQRGDGRGRADRRGHDDGLDAPEEGRDLPAHEFPLAKGADVLVEGDLEGALQTLPDVRPVAVGVLLVEGAVELRELGPEDRRHGANDAVKGVRERHRLDARPETLEDADRLLERFRHLGVHLDVAAELRAETDPGPPDAGSDARREIRHGNVLRPRVSWIVAGHRLQHQRGVAHRARHGADVVEAEDVGADAAETDAPVRGLQPHDAAEGGGDADGAARVRAEGPGREASGHRHSGSTAGPARDPVQVPGIARGAVVGIDRGRCRRELVGQTLAEEDGAGLAQTRDTLRVLARDVVAKEAGAVRGADARGVEDVLGPVGHAVQRSTIVTADDLALGFLGLGARHVRRDGEVGGQLRVQRLDPSQVGFDDLDG